MITLCMKYEQGHCLAKEWPTKPNKKGQFGTVTRVLLICQFRALGDKRSTISQPSP